jgi:hypothetical protein
VIWWVTMRTQETVWKRGKADRRTVEAAAPPWLREILERSRLSLRALFRALDHLGLVQELPAEVQTLFHLDGDLAEALWALDQPIKRLNVAAMTQDTIFSLGAIPEALTAFLKLLSSNEQARLASEMKAVRASLARSDAYLQIPGRDPNADG